MYTCVDACTTCTHIYTHTLHTTRCSERFIGHPSSVDSIANLDDETVVTGSSDGLLRVISIEPNRFIGLVRGVHMCVYVCVYDCVAVCARVPECAFIPIATAAASATQVGQHGLLPVERVRKSPTHPLLVTVSHDGTLRVWDVSALTEDAEDSSAEEEEEDDQKGEQESLKRKQRPDSDVADESDDAHDADADKAGGLMNRVFGETSAKPQDDYGGKKKKRAKKKSRTAKRVFRGNPLKHQNEKEAGEFFGGL
jgi:WD40 repeat protein